MAIWKLYFSNFANQPKQDFKVCNLGFQHPVKGNMNLKTLSFAVKGVALVTILSYAASAQAITPPTQSITTFAPTPNSLETVAFSDTAEAGLLHRAYRILATGDHDYHGHRVRAMHHIEQAPKLLGLDLSGDLKDHEKQVLSDDRLREASGYISKVLNSAVVKDQKRVTKHLTQALDEINGALKTH